MDLVFDRSASDVQYATQLRNKVLTQGFNALTDEEKADWQTHALKGFYNYTDKNRVESAVEQINKILIKYGYMNNTLTIVKDRNMKYIDDKASITRYLNNIQALIDNFYVLPVTPELVENFDMLDITKANNIEKILYDINNILVGTLDYAVRSGVANCGQNRIWQNRFRRG